MRKIIVIPVIVLAGLAISASMAFAATTTPNPVSSASNAVKIAAAGIANTAKKATAVASTKAVTATPAAVVTGAKVNINTATRAELLKVPGVGAKMVKKIVQYRPYTNFTKLEQKLIKYFPLSTVKKVESNFSL